MLYRVKLRNEDDYLILLEKNGLYTMSVESKCGSRVIGSFSNLKEALEEFFDYFKINCELGE